MCQLLIVIWLKWFIVDYECLETMFDETCEEFVVILYQKFFWIVSGSAPQIYIMFNRVLII